MNTLWLWLGFSLFVLVLLALDLGILHRFHYLKYGLSLVLMVVGGKMLLNAWFGAKVVPTEVALLITAALIGGTVNQPPTSGSRNRSRSTPLACRASDRAWRGAA